MVTSFAVKSGLTRCSIPNRRASCCVHSVALQSKSGGQRHHLQQRAQAAPQAGLEHAISPQVVQEDAGRARVRQDVGVPLRGKIQCLPWRPGCARYGLLQAHGLRRHRDAAKVAKQTVQLELLGHLVQALGREGPMSLCRACVMVVNEGHCPGRPPSQDTCASIPHVMHSVGSGQ
jgi:hypothetical protein